MGARPTLVLLVLSSGCDLHVLELGGRARSGLGDGNIDAGLGDTLVAADPCADFQCAPGQCVVANGTASCLCPEGTLRDGVRCRACVPAPGGQIDVEIPARLVGLSVRVGAERVTSGVSIDLRGVDSGVRIGFTEVSEQKWVPVGRYAVTYTGHLTASSDVPANRGRPLGEVEIAAAPGGAAQAPQVLSFDLEATRVVGTLDMGGGHDAIVPLVNLVFVDEAGGKANVNFLDQDKHAFATVLAPGRYTVGLAGPSGGAVTAFGTLDVARQSGIFNTNVRIPSARVTVRLSFSGASEGAEGVVYLQSPLARFRMEPVGGNRFVAWVPHDTYGVTFALVGEGEPGQPLQITAPVVAQIEVRRPSLEVGVPIEIVRALGRITVDGRAPVPDGMGFRLRSPLMGSVPVSLDATGAFMRSMMPGEYWLQYECQRTTCRDGSRLPANREATLGPIEVRAGAGNIFDFPVGVAQLSVTENGRVVDGALELVRGPDSGGIWGATTLVTGDGPRLDTRVVYGSYTALYRRTGRGTLMWRVGTLPIEAWRENQGTVRASWDLDIVRMQGRIGYGSEVGVRRYRIENPDYGYVSFETEADGSFAIDVPAAAYILRAGPGGGQGAIGCFEITP